MTPVRRNGTHAPAPQDPQPPTESGECASGGDSSGRGAAGVPQGDWFTVAPVAGDRRAWARVRYVPPPQMVSIANPLFPGATPCRVEFRSDLRSNEWALVDDYVRSFLRLRDQRLPTPTDPEGGAR